MELLREIATRYELTELETELQLIDADNTVEVGFLGEYSSGKSTLINSLVCKEDLLPVKVAPSTASICRVVAVAGCEEPRYLRLSELGSYDPTDLGTFTDIALGILPGRIMVQLPPTAGFPCGFVFVDTPGLGSLMEAHAEVTLGELPFMDAAVICIDANKGGLNESVLDFLAAPGIRHLTHRFLIALTQSDKLAKDDWKKVNSKVVSALSLVLNLPADVVRQRVLSVSAEDSSKEPGVGSLRAVIGNVFEGRRAALSDERRARAVGFLVPRTIEVLVQHRDALGESPAEFDIRRKKLSAKAKELEAERRRQRTRLDKFQRELRVSVGSVCKRHRSPLGSARTKEEVELAANNLADALSQAVCNAVEQLGSNLDSSVGGVEGELKRVLNHINRSAELGKTLATAAITAWVIPGAGPSKDAMQAGGGAAGRSIAAKGAQKAGKEVAKKASKRTAMKSILTNFLEMVDEINPINYAGDLIAEQIKLKTVDNMLAGIIGQTVTHAGKILEDHFESEIFSGIESQLTELNADLEAVAKERRTNLDTRSGRQKQIDEEIGRLESVTMD